MKSASQIWLLSVLDVGKLYRPLTKEQYGFLPDMARASKGFFNWYTWRAELLLEALGLCTAAIAEEKEKRVVVIHGAGSFGHFEVRELGLTAEGIARTRQAVTSLSKIVCDELTGRGARPVSLAPFGIVQTTDGRLARDGERALCRAATAALDAGLLPVFHGDIVLDSKRGAAVLSGDDVLAAICRHGVVDRAIFVTDVEGVYDKNPRLDPTAKLIPELTSRRVDTAGATDATGGMRAKLDAAFRAARAGVPVTILAPPQFPAALKKDEGDGHVTPSTRVRC
ncbi:hypothetical protein CTAYLR_003004 [Chrysophaeum taylorii]|uniref:Isopentenyl phosphate kinase n=1 Tax=Chrysophaeum taylorii TaxID=2483200 RepID=A0AAD7XGH8_9STRA|nr:hypothetical protein CTAYLR_003004 [Chrysophaeum taylorii]